LFKELSWYLPGDNEENHEVRRITGSLAGIQTEYSCRAAGNRPVF